MDGNNNIDSVDYNMGESTAEESSYDAMINEALSEISSGSYYVSSENEISSGMYILWFIYCYENFEI